MAHAIEDKELSDEEYDENADEDFNPEQAGEDEEASSSEDEQPTKLSKAAKNIKKRKAEAEAGDELDSGDEATIQERSKKRKRATADDEDSGGEGGLIKTRAQRLAEKIERKQRKKGVQGEVTVDVDALWADLQNASVGRDRYVPSKGMDGGDAEEDKENAGTRALENEDEMITIKRRIEYAGEITEVEERVPRSSKEAQRYLREHPEADPSHPGHQENTDPEAASSINRPLRRPSLFEPNPSAIIKGVAPEKLRPRAPNRLDVLMAERRLEEERKKKAEKMSTVQKSALDWRGWVDKQDGLREELDVYGRSKQGFLAREDFLGRAEYAREVQAREARLKG